MKTEIETKAKKWIAAELTRRHVALHYHWRIQTGEDRDSDLIAIVPAEYPGDDAGEEGIAKLIAAAPELLEALSGMLENYVTLKRISLMLARSDASGWMPSLNENDDIHVIAARSAIAKAEGKEV